MNKKIKIILVLALILSINFSVFAQSDYQEETIIEDESEEILETGEEVELDLDIEVDESEQEKNNKESFEEHQDSDAFTEDEVSSTFEETEEINIEGSKEGQDQELVLENEAELNGYIDLNSKEKVNLKEENTDVEDVEKKKILKKEKRQSEHVYISSWSEFVDAYNNENVKKIILKNNIAPSPSSRMPTEERKKSLEVDGQGHQIDTESYRLREVLFKLNANNSEDSVLKLKNLILVHSTRAIVEIIRGSNENSRWHVELENIYEGPNNLATHVVNGQGYRSISITGDLQVNTSGAILGDMNAEVSIDKARLEGSNLKASIVKVKDSELSIQGSTLGIEAQNFDLVNSQLFIQDSTQGIEAQNLDLINSQLFIQASTRGIEAQNLDLVNSQLFIQASTRGIEVKSLSLKNQSHIDVHISSTGSAYFALKVLEGGYFDLQDSDIKIDSRTHGIISETQTPVKIENSDLDIIAGRNGIVSNDLEVDTAEIYVNAKGKGFSTDDLYLTNVQVSLESGGIGFDTSNLEIEGATITLESGDIGFDTDSSKINRVAFDLKTVKDGFKAEDLSIFDTMIDLQSNGIPFHVQNIMLKNSTVTVGAINTSFLEAKKLSESSHFEINDSEVSWESKNAGSAVILGTNNNISDQHLIFTGDKTVVWIQTHAVSDSTTGVFDIRGDNVNSKNPSGIYIKNGAKVNILGKGGTQIVRSRLENGMTEISGEGTEFNIKRTDDVISTRPMFRYYLVGDQTFKVTDKAKVNIEANKITAPIFRMYGGNNHFLVYDGANVKMHSKGDGRPTTPSGTYNNQGIVFRTGRGTRDRFELKCSGSSMEIIAENGAAIDGASDDIDVFVGEDTVFVAEGNTPSDDAIFVANSINFVTDKPRYYDFVNRAKSGGHILSTSQEETQYTSNTSDVAVWKKGDNLEGNPYRSWSQFNFKLKGQNLRNIVESDHPEFNESDDSFGSQGLSAYTRISGNNASADIDFMRPNPYDTDRYIYGHAVVPEGFENYRNAWTDEVHVTLKETLPNGKVNEYKDLPTVGMEHGNAGYPVYDTEENERGGYFRLDLGEGNLAEIGAKYEVISAYRGDIDLPEKRRIYSEGPFPKEVVVSDKTPPKVSEVEVPIYDHQKIINGRSEEKNVNVYFAVNGQILKNSQGKELSVQTNDKGEWAFDLENVYDLQINDRLQVVLEDQAGNRNPLLDTPFHDIVKEKATTVVVEESKFVLEAKETFILLKDFEKNIKNDQDLMDLMEVKAYEEREMIIDHDAKIIDHNGLNYQNTKAKSYTLRFSIEGHEEVRIDQKIHIFPHDYMEQNDEYLILANDFYDGHRAYLENDAYFIDKADAKAYRKDDLEQELIVSLKPHNISKEADEYTLSFYIKDEEDVETSVLATILDRNHVVETKKYVIAANDFKIMKYEAVEIRDDEIIHHSKAYAFEKTSNEDMPVRVISHNIQAIKNQYRAQLGIRK